MRNLIRHYIVIDQDFHAPSLWRFHAPSFWRSHSFCCDLLADRLIPLVPSLFLSQFCYLDLTNVDSNYMLVDQYLHRLSFISQLTFLDLPFLFDIHGDRLVPFRSIFLQRRCRRLHQWPSARHGCFWGPTRAPWIGQVPAARICQRQRRHIPNS